MSITSIATVDSVKGSGKITFFVNTDGTGCDESINTTLEGEKFTTHSKHGPNATAKDSISHTKSGLHTVVVTADTSGVSSSPVVLDL